MGDAQSSIYVYGDTTPHWVRKIRGLGPTFGKVATNLLRVLGSTDSLETGFSPQRFKHPHSMRQLDGGQLPGSRRIIKVSPSQQDGNFSVQAWSVF